MGGSRGLAAAPEIRQTPWEEEQGQQAQLFTFSYAYWKQVQGHNMYIKKQYNKAKCEHIFCKSEFP